MAAFGGHDHLAHYRPPARAAQVLSVGPGALNRDGVRIAMNVKVGDKVLLPEYGGHTLKDGDQEMLLVRDEDILAVIQE